MNATEAAVRHDDRPGRRRVASAATCVTMVVDIREMARGHAGAAQIAHELRFRQALIRRQRRANTDAITTSSAAREGARKVVLKHAPARRRGARLEDGPDATARLGRAHRGERFGDRGGMMREVVVDGDVTLGADELEPALHAEKIARALRAACRGRRRTPHRPLSRRAHCARYARRRSGTVNTPRSWPRSHRRNDERPPCAWMSPARQSNAVGRAEGLHATTRDAGQRRGIRAVCADQASGRAAARG